MYQEDICVLKSAPNKESAYKFMEFYLNPENPALNTEQQLNISANGPSREALPDDLRNNPYINPPAEASSAVVGLGSGTREQVYRFYKCSSLNP